MLLTSKQFNILTFYLETIYEYNNMLRLKYDNITVFVFGFRYVPDNIVLNST